MSIYGYFVCHDCEVAIWLGKALRDDHCTFAYHQGTGAEPTNSKNDLLTRSIWKFLAEHTGHAVAVLIEGAPDFDRMSEYREIGGDAIGDISLDDYVRDFKG